MKDLKGTVKITIVGLFVSFDFALIMGTQLSGLGMGINDLFLGIVYSVS